MSVGSIVLVALASVGNTAGTGGEAGVVGGVVADVGCGWTCGSESSSINDGRPGLS